MGCIAKDKVRFGVGRAVPVQKKALAVVTSSPLHIHLSGGSHVYFVGQRPTSRKAYDRRACTYYKRPV